MCERELEGVRVGLSPVACYWDDLLVGDLFVFEDDFLIWSPPDTHMVFVKASPAGYRFIGGYHVSQMFSDGLPESRLIRVTFIV